MDSRDPQQTEQQTRIAAKAEAVLQKVRARTARGRRILEQRGPQTVETGKSAIFLRGSTSSPLASAVLSDLYKLKKPDGALLSRRAALHPFDETGATGSQSIGTLEFLCQKNAAASFALLASHSKKRPHALTVCRMFDGRLLDMVELLVRRHQPLAESAAAGVGLGAKPAFVLLGEAFELDERYRRVKSLLVDCFRGRIVEQLDLLGLESCIVLAARGTDELLFRGCRVQLRASGGPIPSVALSPMGPAIDFGLGRQREASDELWREACRQPRELTGAPKGRDGRNIRTTALRERVGRVHVGRQDLASLQTRKVKALKKTRSSGEKAVDGSKI